MLPRYYQHYNPVKIVSGRAALESLPFELMGLGSSKPLVVTDEGIVKAGILDIVLKTMEGSPIEIGAVYDRVPPDSSHVTVNEVAGLYRKAGCDSLVAVGGGSVMDTAKAANIVISEDSDDLMKFVGADCLTAEMRPLLCIPTTAGTGSEVTLAAMVAHVDKNCKMGFTSYRLLPRVAILDPRMYITAPPRITAMAGMDALAHAVEAYSCLQKNPMSDAYAFKAIDLIRRYLLLACERGEDEEARMGMANAALLAGIAVSNSMVGLVHAIGHAAGGVCHVPHGLAMAILLPFCMEYNLAECDVYYSQLLLPLAGEDEYARTPSSNRARSCIRAVRHLNLRLKDMTGMPVTLKDAGVKREQLPLIAEGALGDGAVVFNPREADYEDILKILMAAY